MARDSALDVFHFASTFYFSLERRDNRRIRNEIVFNCAPPRLRKICNYISNETSRLPRGRLQILTRLVGLETRWWVDDGGEVVAKM